jgi:hypothetical protein
MSMAGSSGGPALLPADAQAARLCVGVSGGLAGFAFLVSKMTAAVRRNPMMPNTGGEQRDHEDRHRWRLHQCLRIKSPQTR